MCIATQRSKEKRKGRRSRRKGMGRRRKGEKDEGLN
jgi:hypothetical protein